MAAAIGAVGREEKMLAASTVLEAEAPGTVIAAFARALNRTKRTIRRWVQQHREGRLGETRPGPDPTPVEWAVRQGLCVVLGALGAMADEQLMKRLFPEATFRVIRGMKQRFCKVLARRTRRGKSRLEWTRPGRVWAMDFTQPKAKLPGKHKRLFMVRDLSSGYRLACVPCPGERAQVVIDTLEILFGLYGAPLVIKHDGGSAFQANRTYELFEAHGVEGLCSPAYTPEYNGSIERSLGWDKLRIEQIAEQAGHAGTWSEDDIERARQQANATLFPRGLKGATPDKAFAARNAITKKEREAFQRTVHEKTQAVLKTHVDESGRLITDVPFDVMKRRAITRALAKHGYLKIRRGRLSTPHPGNQPDRNS